MTQTQHQEIMAKLETIEQKIDRVYGAQIAANINPQPAWYEAVSANGQSRLSAEQETFSRPLFMAPNLVAQN